MRPLAHRTPGAWSTERGTRTSRRACSLRKDGSRGPWAKAFFLLQGGREPVPTTADYEVEFPTFGKTAVDKGSPRKTAFVTTASPRWAQWAGQAPRQPVAPGGRGAVTGRGSSPGRGSPPREGASPEGVATTGGVVTRTESPPREGASPGRGSTPRVGGVTAAPTTGGGRERRQRQRPRPGYETQRAGRPSAQAQHGPIGVGGAKGRPPLPPGKGRGLRGSHPAPAHSSSSGLPRSPCPCRSVREPELARSSRAPAIQPDHPQVTVCHRPRTSHPCPRGRGRGRSYSSGRSPVRRGGRAAEERRGAPVPTFSTGARHLSLGSGGPRAQLLR